MSSSQKRSILITGCSKGGAGHALALEFARQGMRVFATARSTNSLKELESQGIETLVLDVTNAESIAALKAEITSRTGGKLDMLFNNAGLMYEAPAIEADSATTRRMFETNVFGVFEMISTFTPLLIAAVGDAKHPPTIINTASILARAPYPFSAAYNASKAAVASYSDTLRIELKPLGVKVVTLFMGQVATGLLTPSSIDFGANSLYASAEAGVKKRGEAHLADSVKPEAFAKSVVNEVLRNKPRLEEGESIWKGTKSTLIWLLSTFGPSKVFDGTVEKEGGLTSDSKDLIAKKGRSSVKA
ncbi:hypothetical protein FB567DRAFT_21444 [Paraphoma chrysanthemicola]|uniref:NADPH-dependent 1-acyldihydroxyacetone phosphate reductase n=1 Tax=Paraphoma chrysanthemicola TaxID=798071 RepID=A0A8K0RHY2_9PLEO|nr:hypothetical protein FB567DRAFT_21444 [Paraphoma chrysanthemicola]